MNIDMQKDPNSTSSENDSSAFTSDEDGMTADQADGDETTVLEDRIKTLEEELLDAKDRFLRQAAEMENMRRRQEKERSDLLKYASEKLLQDLLPVLDSFDKAMQTAGAESHPIVEGVKMVEKQLTGILDNHGLKAVDAAGKTFDPNLHQAIQRIESEEGISDVIKDEFQKGYTLNGRLIRPSMVSVYVNEGTMK